MRPQIMVGRRFNKVLVATVVVATASLTSGAYASAPANPCNNESSDIHDYENWHEPLGGFDEMVGVDPGTGSDGGQIYVCAASSHPVPFNQSINVGVSNPSATGTGAAVRMRTCTGTTCSTELGFGYTGVVVRDGDVVVYVDGDDDPIQMYSPGEQVNNASEHLSCGPATDGASRLHYDGSTYAIQTCGYRNGAWGWA